MKLCFICYEYPPGPVGGVGTFTQMLGRALVRRGHEVRVAGVYSASYPAPDYEEDDGVRVWRLRESERHLSWVASRYALYRLIRGWVDAGESDLVEAPDCYGWFAGWPRLPVPRVARAHGSLTYYAHELNRPVSRLGHRLESWSYRRTDAWIAVSEHAGVLTRQLFSLPHAPTVLYNPIDLPDGAPNRTARTRGLVLFSGTLTPKKGVVTLLDAWPSIVAAAPYARLHVYGKDQRDPDGGSSMQRWLTARLSESLRPTVIFHGHVDRPVLLRALHAAEVAVFPSYTETFGLGAVEAMACGCPTVYTKRSCGPEIVRDGVTGLLVDPDDASEVAHAVLRVLLDPEGSARLGAAARAEVATRFALEPLVRANEVLFATLAGRGRRGGG